MLIVQTRGPCVETRHPVRAVAVRGAEVLWQTGPDVDSPWRSAAKPLQLWCSLDALGDPDLDPIDVALGASSHAGQPAHVARLRAIGARLGVTEDALRCGAEPPLHRPSWEEMLARGEPATAIHNDCSGKHTFFAAATARNGWPADYRAPDHPLQRRVIDLVTRVSGAGPTLGVDGCGVPVMCLPITAMARAWAWLAAAMADCNPWLSRSASADAGTVRASRIGWAMASNPWWTSGDGRLDLEVAQGARVPMVGKIGAQGVFCMAVPSLRLGIAVKSLSGDEDALAIAVGEALARAAPDAWSPPSPWPRALVRNVVGMVVGERVAFHGEGV